MTTTTPTTFAAALAANALYFVDEDGHKVEGAGHELLAVGSPVWAHVKNAGEWFVEPLAQVRDILAPRYARVFEDFISL
ncbi:hypothetical protein HER32_06815 [Hymenobacter sp. BT18]|uniref:hypothetical protein n=1 Tax=Hymenobacter sp. BT18 TaxID=2835648 RepID=UPI00143EF111|nr:hypothetical protein [Hymenobacter sp. BT18]QIX60905.1 hypothetical protein HER32_06815 [Hymenobacter sp. BT18]